MITQTDLTFAGRRLTQKDTLAYYYQDPTRPDALRGFRKPLVAGHKVGTIVRLSEEGDNYFIGGPHAPRAVGHAPQSDQLLRWSLDQEADVALHAQRLESKRIAAQGEDPIRAALDPVRRLLAEMSPSRRMATIGWIITFLTHGQRR